VLRDPDLNAIARAFEPDLLVETVAQDQHDQLAEKAEIRIENARKFINAVNSHNMQDVLELQAIDLPDHPEIKYEVEPGREKTIRELSVGQKGTVIISLALIEGQSPLVIDQPEEPLDTLSIYDQVVGTVRKQKDVRQFVFTTHNPNVAVGADAELNYVLEASADKGRVKASGGIDEIDTNKLLLVHLEGGRQAFDLRARKYLQ
jgi:ABC-type glutathione transport system ATPase component